MNNRLEEAKVAARKSIRASLCQSTPIAAHLAEVAAEAAATKGMEILSLGMDGNLSTIKKIQVSECLKNALQARHDVTFAQQNEMHSTDNADHWKRQGQMASQSLNGYLTELGQLLGIEDVLDLLI